MSPRVRDPLTIELALLGFLKEKPRHGYEIYRQLSDSRGMWMIWRMKTSQLYALLGRLEDAGYVTSVVEPQQAGPPRKVYRLTPTGNQAFDEWVRSPVKHGRELRLDFLAKLFFALREGKEIVLRLIKDQRHVCHQWLDTRQASDELTFESMVYDYRTGQIRAMLQWLDQCERRLGSSTIS